MADPTLAQTPQRQQANYDVYASGFHVLKANLDVDFRKEGEYRVLLAAETRGFIAKVAHWAGSFETQGWYDAAKRIARPRLHKSSAHWKDELEVKEYSYNRDGTFGEYRVTDKHSEREIRESDKTLTDQTTDVMTAALDLMQSFPKNGQCESEAEIFDGGRRYKLIFKHNGEEQLKATKYNIYSGSAVRCTVFVEPKGGKWHEKPRGWMSLQEQGRQKGKLPTIWMANMGDGQPAVPVKVLVPSNHGAMVMHMTRYESGNNILLAEKQAE